MIEKEFNPFRKNEVGQKKSLERTLEEKGLKIDKKEGLVQILDKERDPVSDTFKKIYFNKNGLLIGEGKLKEKWVLDPETFNYAEIVFLDDPDGSGNTGKYCQFQYERSKVSHFDPSKKAALTLRQFLESRGARVEKKQGKKSIVSEKSGKLLTDKEYPEIYLTRSEYILAKTEQGNIEKLGSHFKPVPVSFDELKRIEGTNEYEARVGKKKMRVSFEFGAQKETQDK